AQLHLLKAQAENLQAPKPRYLHHPEDSGSILSGRGWQIARLKTPPGSLPEAFAERQWYPLYPIVRAAPRLLIDWCVWFGHISLGSGAEAPIQTPQARATRPQTSQRAPARHRLQPPETSEAQDLGPGSL